jgi:hypothetical protein
VVVVLWPLVKRNLAKRRAEQDGAL